MSYPTKSCLRKNDDTATTFDFLQEDNGINPFAPTCDNTATFTLRNLEDTGIIDENGQKRRKSTGRRVSFATTAHIRLYVKDDAANGLPASSNGNNDVPPPKVDSKKQDPPSMGVQDMSLNGEEDMSLVIGHDSISSETSNDTLKKRVDSEKQDPPSMRVHDMSLDGETDMSLVIGQDLISSETSNDTLKKSVESEKQDPPSMGVQDMSLDGEEDMSLVIGQSSISSETSIDTLKKGVDTEKQDPHSMGVQDMSLDGEEDMSLVIGQSSMSSETPNDTLFNVPDVSLIENEKMPLVEGVTTTFADEEDDMDIDEDYIPTPDVTSEELRIMKEAIEEQSAQIQIFEAERDNLIKELRNLQSQRTKLQNEKTELNKGIDEAKRLAHENKCFTEEDRIRYRDQYENLIAAHLWRPVKLSDEFTYMIYDNSLEVKINLKPVSGQGESITSIIDVSLIANDKMNTEDKQYYQLMLCGIHEFIMQNINGPIQIAEISRILKDIVSYWQKVKKLYREIFVLSFRFPTELIASNDDNAKLDVLSYPMLENIEWRLDHSYGDIE
ncbi:20918_t:CDS:2 [Cetraspora pellucida]|uniref:20918_t:CDS:1 n=1 Tax=Cetraspora pellucida TaxID=1433469 RepID=A0A9N9EAV7_9GLOM|nr:20918_t:CDS:2 [Cetraspora pellucida]